MKEEKDILKQIDHRDGMTVPDGYFADFATRMASSLPSTPFEKSETEPKIAVKPGLWHRLRPYVYMAAMFMGVWCMLKMFTLLTGSGDQQWEPSPTLADALDNEVFVNEYIISDMSQWEVIDDMMEEGLDPEAVTDSIETEIVSETTTDNDLN